MRYVFGIFPEAGNRIVIFRFTSSTSLTYTNPEMFVSRSNALSSSGVYIFVSLSCCPGRGTCETARIECKRMSPHSTFTNFVSFSFRSCPMGSAEDGTRVPSPTLRMTTSENDTVCENGVSSVFDP